MLQDAASRNTSVWNVSYPESRNVDDGLSTDGSRTTVSVTSLPPSASLDVVGFSQLKILLSLTNPPPCGALEKTDGPDDVESHPSQEDCSCCWGGS